MAQTSIAQGTTVSSKDSMKSTWRMDKSSWTFHHWLYEVFSVHPSDVDKKPIVHRKSDSVPVIQNWRLQRWVFIMASIPLVLQQLFIWIFGHNLHPVAAFLYFTVAYHAIAINELNILRRLGIKYGFLDGDEHARDEVPDIRVRQVITSLTLTATFRPLMAIALAYRRTEAPSSINPVFLIIELSVYGVVLDFWFYWYHRLMHQTNALWKYHRTHHLTKHPNPLLTLYADHEQEVIDIAFIPALTYITLKLVGLPMGFYEWWYCHQFIVFAELLGHSGLRVHASAPNIITPLLIFLNMDLLIEDHDLHHRFGWKKSHNYGKQTRVWDKIFGTCRERVETTDENVNYHQKLDMPLY